ESVNLPLQDAPAWAVKLLLERVSVNAQIGELPEDLPPVGVEDLPVQPGIKDLIHDGLLHHPSRSEAAFAVEMAMIEAGCDDPTIASVLLDPANGISEMPREKGQEWLAGDIGRAHAKADQKVELAVQPQALSTRQEECFILLTEDEVEKLPPPTWLIDGVLPKGGLVVVYGPPGV